MTKFINKVFGISFQDNQLIDIDSKFNLEREMDDYDDTTFYLSNKTYHHDLDPDLKFDYRYGIEAYKYEEDDDKSTHVFYTLYLIPEFGSISKKRQHDVIAFSGVDDPNTMDVFDYGMSIVLAREETLGESDKNIMDKIASVVDTIDSLRGFYLDKSQNHIGTTGWMMLDDFINDKDWFKETLDYHTRK